MSGGANKAFLANPANWLANNVLLIAVNPTTGGADVVSHTEGVTIPVNIVKTAYKATLAGGRSKSVYKLERGNPNPSKNSKQFNAHFLPWVQNGKTVMTLDANADYFFTDTMNGCSFAAGPGASPKVGHFNYQIDNTSIDVAKINTEVGGEFPGGTRNRVDKADYMDQHGMVEITTLGVKNGARWNFYYQTREIISKIPPRWALPNNQPVAIP